MMYCWYLGFSHVWEPPVNSQLVGVVLNRQDARKDLYGSDTLVDRSVLFEPVNRSLRTHRTLIFRWLAATGISYWFQSLTNRTSKSVIEKSIIEKSVIKISDIEKSVIAIGHWKISHWDQTSKNQSLRSGMEKSVIEIGHWKISHWNWTSKISHWDWTSTISHWDSTSTISHWDWTSKISHWDQPLKSIEKSVTEVTHSWNPFNPFTPWVFYSLPTPV